MNKAVLYSIDGSMLSVGYLSRCTPAIIFGWCMFVFVTAGILYIYRLVMWDWLVEKFDKKGGTED